MYHTLLLLWVIGCIVWAGPAWGLQVRLRWTDTSTNEDGFRIERRLQNGGSFAPLAQIAANNSTFADTSVTLNTAYCYRVRAFTNTLLSPFSNEQCVLTTATTSPPTSPPPSGQTVYAVNVGGPAFVASDGTHYLADTNFIGGRTGRTTAAIANTVDDPLYQDERIGDFTYQIPLANGQYTVTLKFVEIFWSAAGKRRFDIFLENKPILSDIDLFSTVGKFVAYDRSFVTDVTDGNLSLHLLPDADAGQLSAIRVVKTTQTVSAQGATPSQGGGTVSTPPQNGNNGSVPLNAAERITVYRPSTGTWYIDRNGNGNWDACQTDTCVATFGQRDALPVIGQWSGGKTPRLGLFTPQTGAWVLDLNGNGQIDACTVDRCAGPFGLPGDIPVAAQLQAGSPATIGVYRPKESKWYIDANGNGRWDGCAVDVCAAFGLVGDRPATGDWTGNGTVTIGVFRPSTGLWYLDANGNGRWDGCTVDRCVGPFGVSSDQPVVGNWTGTGPTKLGVFDPTTALWELDANGNGHWDGCAVDRCLGPFGLPKDVPFSAPWEQAS